MDDSSIDPTLKKIHQALLLNKMLTEQFEWKRQELLTTLESLDFNKDNSIPYDNNQTNDSIVTQKRKSTMLLTNFCKPYLCDERGLRAPFLFNPEHSNVLETHIQYLLIYPRYNRRWTKNEEKIIYQETRNQHLFKQTRSIVKQLEELLSLKNRTANQVETINKLNSDLALMKTKHEEPERFSTTIDWLVIAKHLSEDDDRSDEDCELYYNNYLHSSINREPWTPNEDAKLLELVEQYGESQWDLIAEHLQTGRLPWQCCARYQSELNPSMKRVGPIVGEEAQQLNELIKQWRTINGDINWKQVGLAWEGRLLPQIKHFYRKQQQPKKKYAWTRLEDKIIYAGVKYYGRTQFTKIAKHLSRRNNRQIRERYACHLALSHCNRQFGNWQPNEDLKLIQLCAEYLKRDQKIDYAELNRKEFPQRNTHQLFSRFNSFRKKLPHDFYKYPIDEEKLANIHTTRKMYRKIRKPPKLPDDRIKLYEYIKRLSNRLKSGQTDDCEDEEEEEIELESESHPLKPTSLNALAVLTNPTQSENCGWTIDACIQLYTQLQPFAKFFQRRCVYDTHMDVRVPSLMQTILLELLDRNIQENLYEELPGNNDDDDQKYPVSPLTLDTIRFFLNNTSVSVNYKDDSLRCLFIPNQSTIFGYALMQLIFNSMLIHSAECNYDIDEDNIINQSEFQELRSIFTSLFLWPALLSRDDDRISNQPLQTILTNEIEKLTKKQSSSMTNLEQTKEPSNKTIVENASHTVARQRGPGRPRKKQFFQSMDNFLKTRSIQREIFQSNLEYSDFNVKSSQFWIKEPRSILIERVKIFVDHIQKEIEKNLEMVKQNKIEKKSSKDIKKKISNKRERKSIEVEQLRRSNRISSKEMTQNRIIENEEEESPKAILKKRRR